MIEDSLGALPQNKTDATRLSPNTSFITTSLANSESLPGPSKQIIPPQDNLQAWLSNIQNQLLFLSEFEHSDAFTLLISILNSQEEDKKKCIEFLQALDNLSSKTNNISFATQFFIEEVLKNTRFLIALHRDCSTKLINHTENLDQANFAEDLKNLQNRLHALKKEKSQLERLQHPDAHITRLSELTRDFEKLKIEKCRDFTNEISQSEALLETKKRELEKIKENLEVNEELLTPDDKIEVELKFNQRKLSNLQGDLYFLQDLEKQIDSLEINQTFLELSNLENNRLSLISEWEKYDPIAILLKEIEAANIDSEKFRTETRITTELSVNKKNIEAITETLENIFKFLSNYSHDNNIGTFLIKVKSILDIMADKRKLEAKTIKIAKKLIKRTKSEDTTKALKDTATALKAQYEMDKDLSKNIHEDFSLNQERVYDFLQKNNLELKKKINKLIFLTEKVNTQLENKKYILQLITNKVSLINEINELEEKINIIKIEKYVFKLLQDHNILEKLVILERLQNKIDNKIHQIDELDKQIDEIKKNIAELQKDKHIAEIENNKEALQKDKRLSTVQLNKKITRLENKKTQHYSNLNKLEKDHETQIELEKLLRDPIESTLNNIKNTLTLDFPDKLLQNEEALRVNLAETTQLTKQIAELKNKAKQNQIENRLFQVIKKSQNFPTSPDNNLFEKLKNQLYLLKDQIENPAWNKSGWGFFYKKVPDGIQKLRTIFNGTIFISFESEADQGKKNLMMLNLFSRINFLIDKKHSTRNCFLRNKEVNDLYQSFYISLNQINIDFFDLKDSTAETNEKATQSTCFSFSQS